MADRLRRVPGTPRSVALAVNPVDALNGRPLRDAATVSVGGVHHEPTLNPSGYWVFLDPPVSLPGGVVTVDVEPPPSYVHRTLEVDPTALPTPGVRVDVFPSTAYALGAGTTALEGTVTDGSTAPVAGATVGLERTALETRTGRDGGFLLVVTDVVTTDAAEPDDPLRVDPTDAEPDEVLAYPAHGPPEVPTLVVEHPDHGSTTVALDDLGETLTEGERTLLDAPIVL